MNLFDPNSTLDSGDGVCRHIVIVCPTAAFFGVVYKFPTYLQLLTETSVWGPFRERLGGEK